MNLLISTGAIAAIVIVAVVALLIIIALCWGISARNNFVRLRNQCEESFSTIDIYLKKRFDLIPNLVETVKGYAKHECETLTSVVNARSRNVSASTTAEKIAEDAQVSNAIKNINMVAEKYPELKANANFMDLMNQLKAIESQLADQRRYYNAVVKNFNTQRELFPKSVIASMMHLEKAPYFQLDSEEERKNVQVKF